MNELLDNETVEGVIAALVAVLILGLFGWLKFKRDAKMVARLLEKFGPGLSRVGRTTRVNAKAIGGSEQQTKQGRKKPRG